MVNNSAFLALALCLFALPNWANEVSAIRCDGRFIQSGMDKFQVIELCGKPKASEILSGEDEPKVEKLVYRFKRSSSSPLTLMTFKLGKLHKIEQIR